MSNRRRNTERDRDVARENLNTLHQFIRMNMESARIVLEQLHDIYNDIYLNVILMRAMLYAPGDLRCTDLHAMTKLTFPIRMNLDSVEALFLQMNTTFNQLNNFLLQFTNEPRMSARQQFETQVLFTTLGHNVDRIIYFFTMLLLYRSLIREWRVGSNSTRNVTYLQANVNQYEALFCLANLRRITDAHAYLREAYAHVVQHTGDEMYCVDPVNLYYTDPNGRQVARQMIIETIDMMDSLNRLGMMY